LVAATVRLQAAARGRAGLQKVTSQRDLNRRRASAVALTESRAGTVRVTIDPESHRVSILTGILAHRKQSSEAEEAEAAMKVQRIWRGRMERRWLRAAHTAATTVQSKVRSRAAKKELKGIKRAAIKLQAAIRVRKVRRRILELRAAAMHMQAILRAILARRQFKLLLSEHKRAKAASRKAFAFQHTPGTLLADSAFGEDNMLFAEVHKSSVIADKPTEVCVVDRETYLELLRARDAEIVAHRTAFLGRLPIFRANKTWQTSKEALATLAATLIHADYKHGDRVTLMEGKMLIVEGGEIIVMRRLNVSYAQRRRPAVVLGVGTVFGASELSRSLESARELDLIAEGNLRLLWMDPSICRFYLGKAIVQEFVEQEETALHVATKEVNLMSASPRHGSGASPRVDDERLQAMWRGEMSPEEFEDEEALQSEEAILTKALDLFSRTRSSPTLRPLSAASPRKQKSVFVDDPYDPATYGLDSMGVVRPRRPTSGNVAADAPWRNSLWLRDLVLPSTPAPAPPAAASLAGPTRLAGTPSFSRPLSAAGTLGLAHPKPRIAPGTVGVIRPNHKVAEVRGDVCILVDQHGRWRRVASSSMPALAVGRRGSF